MKNQNPEHSEGPVARAIEQETARLPSDWFLWAAFGAIGTSLTLRIAGQKDAANFIGEWAPTILILGMYSKIVKAWDRTNAPLRCAISQCCFSKYSEMFTLKGACMSLNPIRFLTFTMVLLMIVSCSTGTNEKTDAENTARNDLDNSGAAQTPLDQGENERDLEITANIRKAILDDDSLSSDAHNVKIITAGGMVVLRGPVENEREKTTIEARAKEIAGSSKVQSFLEVEAQP